MKLRGKLVLLETVISLIFFFSLLFSVSLLNRTLLFNDFLNETLKVNSHGRRIIQGCETLLYDETIEGEKLEAIWDDITALNAAMSRLQSHQTMKHYSEELDEYLETLGSDWLGMMNRFNPSQEERRFSEFLVQRDSRIDEISSLKKVANFIESKPRDQWVEWEVEVIRSKDQITSLLGGSRVFANRLKEFQDLSSEEVVLARIRRLRNILIFNLLNVLLVTIITFRYRRRLTDLLGFIIKAMEDVAAGDLSARLRIRTDDEFGKLARDFNTVIEILWAKLETVQNILEDVGRSISNEIDLDKAEKAIIYLARKNSSADGVAMFSITGEEFLAIKHLHGDYHPPFKVGENDRPEGEIITTDDLAASFQDALIPLEGNILGQTASTGEATFWKRAEQDGDFNRETDHPYFFSSLINLPLRVGNKVLGVLSLVKNKEGEYFSDLEYTNMLSFGELAAISIDNLLKYLDMLDVFELNREIDIAGEIQKDLLPEQIPRFPGLDLSISSRTLRGINGDFYDAYLLDSSKLLVVVCEVAGKGVPAALVIIMLKTILKLVARPEKKAGQIIQELNRNITERIKIENIASLSLMVLDNNTHEISYASAGHQPMMIYRKEEDIFEEVSAQGIPVGLDKNAEYEEIRLPFKPDDIYLQFTDGIPESRDRDGRIYGNSGMEKIIRKFMDESSERLKTELLDDLDFFQRDTKQWDDQTLLVMRKERK